MGMAQPLSIENGEWSYLITSRTADSRLWFINNPELEERIRGCLARYQQLYNVVIYGFIIMGNHYHLVAKFPKLNRALFMRDFNSAVARLVGRAVGIHGRRSVWARRYSYQILPTDEDVKNWFFYLALNPVSSGLVSRVMQYKGYNSFFDAISGKAREYRWLDWNAYFKAKRHGAQVSEEQFIKIYTLRFSKLPGFEQYSKQDYYHSLARELQARNKDIVLERKKAGRGFLGAENLARQEVGSRPKSSKTSLRHSFRPIVLSLCAQAKHETLSIYFSILSAFRAVSENFVKNLASIADFPPGTYPPPLLHCR